MYAEIYLHIKIYEFFHTILMFFCLGIDTWVRLHARMVVMHPKFTRTSQACRKKFEKIFKAYKEDKMANQISGNDRHESKFYEAMDEWWHQAGQIMKHVLATTNASEEFQGSTPEVDSSPSSPPIVSTSSKSKGKNHFHDRAIDIFEKMAETSTCLMKEFERTNALLERVDHQFDRLINKL